MTNRSCSDNNYSNWNPSDPEECLDIEVDDDVLQDHGWDEEYMEEPDGGKEMLAEAKWKAVRKPVLPWPVFKDVDYKPVAGKRLFDKFRESGLQVIVKMTSIELTPTKPKFPPGSWHVEGKGTRTKVKQS